MPSRSLMTLLHGLVDYAGLYPPAKLGMAAAVDNYATYLHSRESWMLGRFICPVSRLEEFRREAKGLLPKTEIALPDAAAPQADGTGHAGGPAPVLHATPLHHHSGGAGEGDIKAWESPWGLSAIIDGDLEENLDAIFAFNHEHQQPSNGLANIDVIELKAASPGVIDDALDTIPEELYPFFEIPLVSGAGGGAGGSAGDMRGYMTVLAGADAAAKIRTGGLTPDAFPTCETIAEFLVAAAAADVTFKATAGLHHPLRSEHGLTYEPDCPRGVMHGFINMFIAAAAAKRMNAGASILTQLLQEQDASSIRFTEEGVEWRGARLSIDDIADVREGFAISFGSCSFEEPVEDLRTLKLLKR
ncbi:MAG: hypothetical protein H7210_08770 [Pyrinomonadaceae bacterium]|nr:hypothetical protein [Phycisphaerales bacterium]